MRCQIDQNEDIYVLLSQSKDIDQSIFHELNSIPKSENIQFILQALLQDQNQRQVEKEIQEEENIKLFDMGQMLNVGMNDMKRITDVLNNIKDHDFNRENYSLEEYKEVKKDLIIKISSDKKIIEFIKFLVLLTAYDENYIQCGSNSLHLLVQMKVDLKTQSFKNIKIRNTSLISGHFVKCDLSGSEFNNVIIMELIQMEPNYLIVNGRIQKQMKQYSQMVMIAVSIQFVSLLMVIQWHQVVKIIPFVCGMLKKENQNMYYKVMVSYTKSASHLRIVFQLPLVLHQCIYGTQEQERKYINQMVIVIGLIHHDRLICLWDVKTGLKLAKLYGHRDYVRSVCFSPDGFILASSGDDKSICLWEVKTGQQKAKLDCHTRAVQSVCFSPDSATLASGSDDTSIRLWDVKTEQQKAKLDGHTREVMSVCFSPDGVTLTSGSYQEIFLWDAKTQQQIAKLDGHTNTVYSVCFSRDCMTLASGCHDNSICLWDVKTGEQKAKLDGHSSAVYSICYSPDGTTLASGSWDKSIRLWDVKSGQQKAKLDGHSSAVYSICYSPDGTTLASGSWDKSISLWDVKTGQQKTKLDGHSSTVSSINFSPDGNTLVSGSDDNSIRLWNVKTGQQIAKLDGHSSTVSSINFSPDGNTLVSGSIDNSIRLWNVKTSKEILKSDGSYKNLLAQFSIPLQYRYLLTNVNPDLTILRICQNPILEASGTLILQGQFINHQGKDLKPLFNSKGSCFLQDLKQEKRI
ncbi:unnamed protein product [Paramecium octaurelia]|uniref:G-protein beta WD-40 repeats containing protein n=1 Tax=Paramecium octaurelia TaxID=43137 RepID=A0A8S1SCB1_PAROT|nr:unnamed protein product [Paramecium octaurelia]